MLLSKMTGQTDKSFSDSFKLLLGGEETLEKESFCGVEQQGGLFSYSVLVVIPHNFVRNFIFQLRLCNN